MKKSLIICFSILAIAALISCGDSTPQPIIAADNINNELLDSDQLKEDAFFLSRYAHALMYDHEMAGIALDRALDDSLKNLAKRIMEESEIQLEKVKEIAAQNGIALPETLGSKALRKIEVLRAIRVNIFDHDYLEWAADHIDDSLVDLNAVTEKSNSYSSILPVAQTITLNMNAYKKIIDILHEETGYHYN